jgi:tRNA(Ile)-lysidine synthase
VSVAWAGSESKALVADLLGRCAFPGAGTEVVCAVSGGADSLSLLVLAVAAGCDVTAAHVDHGLRPESGEEAEVVRAAASRFGAGFLELNAQVGDGPNLEARARAARHAVLPAGALLGHTMDDQAETMVLNLLRGAGAAGLAAMRIDGRRPLLRLRRSDTEKLCAALGLDPVMDPSNKDPRFRRNRVRHELLQSMASVAERDVVPVLARQADLFAAENDLLDELASGLDPRDCATLQAAPTALVRRALRRFIRDETGGEHPPDGATVARVLAVVNLDVTGTELGGGWRLARTSGRLRIERSPTGSGGRAPSAGQ